MNKTEPTPTKIFNLFQTDVWKSKKSRVFFGTFSSFEKANQGAKVWDLYNYKSDVK